MIVLFIVGVNSLTACGQNPKTQNPELESTAESDMAKRMAVRDIEKEELLVSQVSETRKEPDRKPREETRTEKTSEALKPSGEVTVPEPGSEEPFVQYITEEVHEVPEPVKIPVFAPEVFDTPIEDVKAEETIRNEEYFIYPELTSPADNENEYTEEPPEPEREITAEPVAQHMHSYIATVTAPTCLSDGYTTYSCACGDSFRAEETAKLGHDWVVHTERLCTGQEAHEICGDCGMDLTASGIVGASIAQHAKQHVMADDNATGRTYTSMIELYSDVSFSRCSRCGETK